MKYLIMALEDADAFRARTDADRQADYWASWMGYIEALTASGVLVGAAGLQPPGSSTTVRLREGRRLVQDGPFADSKEHLGGYFLIDVPDLDIALEWAARCPSAGYASVEVRPVMRALQGGRPGPYQLQAAIQSLHNRRAITASTDWAGIAALYDGLVAVTPTVGALVARAAAHAEHAGPEAGRALLDELPDEAVVTSQPFWALRAHLLSRMGEDGDATRAARRAIGLSDDPAVRSFLVSRFPSAAP